MDYAQAKDIMDQHRATVESSHGAVKAVASPIRKRLENKTTLSFVDPAISGTFEPTYELKVFGNPILVFHPDTFEVNDHGWYSRTTHERLNQYMPTGFSIYSRRIPYLEDPKTISFIQTPKGSYPYRMPTTLFYDGSATADWYTGKAGGAMRVVPEYIEENLRRIMHGVPCDNDVNTDALYNLNEDEPKRHSRVLASCITDGFHFAELAMAAVAHSQTNIYREGLSLAEITEVLIIAGSSAFRSPRTSVQIGQKMENNIRFQRPIPNIPANWIKSRLRPMMYEYIVDSLGFERPEWNRR